MKRTFIFVDNTFTSLFQKNTNSRVDFRKLAKNFEQEDGKLESHFFFQKNDTVDWPQYKELVKMFTNFGWEVHNPVEQSISSLSYTPAMESSALIAEAMLIASETLEHEDPVRFVLCVNHLSYAPLLQALKRGFRHIQLILVGDPGYLNDDLAKNADEMCNVYELDIEY